MDKLEQTKAAHPAEDALTDDTAAQAYCEQFAQEIFSKADNAIRTNTVSARTADSFDAARVFLEILGIWKDPPEPEIATKLKYAKYHQVRIVKAIKAKEDPNLSNPVQDPPQVISPPALDPNDPDVQKFNDPVPQTHTPYQPYVESAPNTNTAPSPSFDEARVSPPIIPPASTGYPTQATDSQFSSHRDVSPISPPQTSRKGSVESVGGGYFPRVDVPTFTAENSAPGLPTAPSIEDEPMTTPFNNPSLPAAPQAPDPQSFYQNQPVSPRPLIPQAQPPQNPFQSPQVPYASPPSQQSTQLPQPPQPPPSQSYQQPPIPRQNFEYPPQSPPLAQPLPQLIASPVSSMNHHNGPFKTDEDAIMEAQKHAKWSISALNFEDVNTAVKELRLALHALGAG